MTSRPTQRAGRAPNLDLSAVVTDPRTKIVVTCGSGGVGKTTTAAALALHAAEAGRTVVVLTIDPARRLAQSLGLLELDNTPREVAGIDKTSGGSLFAMMLDMKRTFDDVVAAHTTSDKADQIYANPFYQALSNSFAGTQEYMAMEKLSQLRATGEWDLIVVDTPPSRSALDFLDAPARLGTFLDGRMIRLLAAPARAGGKVVGRVVGASFSIFSKVLDRLLGGQLLHDVSSFVAALETMFGGFRDRAAQTYELLEAEGTAFVVVAIPERDALREASYFVERLRKDSMPLSGLIINRMQPVEATTLSARRAGAAVEALEKSKEPAARLARAALRVHIEATETAAAQAKLAARFTAAHPDVAVLPLPALGSDVHDLPGLRLLGAELTNAR